MLGIFIAVIIFLFPKKMKRNSESNLRPESEKLGSFYMENNRCDLYIKLSPYLQVGDYCVGEKVIHSFVLTVNGRSPILIYI